MAKKKATPKAKGTDTVKPTSQKSPTIKGVEVLFVPGGEPNPFPEPFPTETPSSGETSGRKDGQNAVSMDSDNADTTQVADDKTNFETGNDRISGDSTDLDGVDNSLESQLSSRVSRLPGEGRSGCHERLRRLARAAGMPRGQGPGTAYNWAFDQCDRLFAKPEPIPEPIPVEEPQDPKASEPPTEGNFATVAKSEAIAVTPAPAKDDGSVSGLSELPSSWPELPANAQLQVEIAWVTANRLRVRSGTGVDLSKALSPAPSYSALSWLETSILFPAKFADISVKATAQSDDEREFVKREKMAIEEIRGILSEMLEVKG